MNPYSILLVDDEMNNLRALGRILRRDYVVYSADGVRDALAIMEQNDIALTIADEHIAGIAGIEFFERIVKKYPDTIRILLTTNTDDESPAAMDNGNIYRYVSKPWEPEEIRKVVAEGIDAYEVARSSREPCLWALLNSEVISGKQLATALRIQRTEQKSIGDILLERSVISREQLEMAMETQRTQGKRLDEVLIELGAVSAGDLEMAREAQKHERKSLPEILVELDYATEEEIFSCYALQLGMPYISLSQLAGKPDAVKLLPLELAYKHTVVPIDSVGRVLVVAASGPLDEVAKSEIEEKTGYKLMAACASHREIEAAMGQYYANETVIKDKQ